MEVHSDEAEIQKPEFDLKSGIQCQYFKSTFARSLMLNQSAASCTRSLDIPVNFLRDDPSSQVDKIHCDSNKICVDVNPHATMDFNKNIQTQMSMTNSPDLTECEVLQLRKKCQNLIEENRRLIIAAHNTSQSSALIQNGEERYCDKVETTILQNKVDTLKWQMQQIESSRQMYRAIMESVAQFLERCHISLEAVQHKDHLVYSSSERPRSAANIRDLDLSLQHSRNPFIDRSPELTHPARSYNKFRDFTWRRSSKQPCNGSVAAEDKVMEVEKLSQEAYRLLRNVTNLLNTQEPMLAQAKNAVEDSTSLIYLAEPSQASPSVDFPRGFKSISRESCSSFRSSSDSNSTVSSKQEIDEELTESISPPPCESRIIVKRSIAEDESGFSSMSSFQEIGLPLISTPRSSSVSSESTTPDSDTSSNLIKIGLPLMPFHRRWESAPNVPGKNGKLRSLSTLGDDESMRVLWV
ncbi:hypothetical protein DMENIID0001_157270 [Sergentomyia squamirostris]